MCERFGYDKMVGMVSGTEGADAAVKFSRKWGIKAKGIKPSEVVVLGVSDNYHGVGSGIWPIMNDMGQASGLYYHFLILLKYCFIRKQPPLAQGSAADSFSLDYGITSESLRNTNPVTGKLLRYGRLDDFEEVLATTHGRVAAVMMECIHGKKP